MPNAGVAEGLNLSEQIVREAIRRTTLRDNGVFVVRYFKDEKNNNLRLKQFHLEMLQAILGPDQRVLIQVPAGHGKTTICSRFAPIIAMTHNPNIRIMHIMNNATDAEQNLAAIQRELEDEKSLVVQEHGPYRGDVWKATEFHVRKRTIIDKDATFAAYGTGSNVFGHRADLVICDDILNLENSGPFVTDRTRQTVRDWFFQGVMKVAAPFGKVIVIGTPMDFRDLYHELEDPKHGFKVIKLRALLDEESHDVLWPERFSYEYLNGEREADMTAFMKRFQCEAIETSALPFQVPWMQNCRNYSRGWGEINDDMKTHNRTVVINGFDPTAGQTKASKWCGFVALATNPVEDPMKFHILEMEHFRLPFDEQIDYIIGKHEKYHARATVIEANGSHQYLLQSKELLKFKQNGNNIVPHFTSVANKPDPIVGLPSLAPLFEFGQLEFPYLDEVSKRWVNYFIAHEGGKYPMAETTDVLMALWFAVLYARSLSPYKHRALRAPMPLWARNVGMIKEWTRPRVVRG